MIHARGLIHVSELESNYYQIGNDLKLIKNIKCALSEDLFLLYAQPITSLQDNFPQQHFEILLRLLDRDGKTILPGSFIEIAERHGLMPNIDVWVINHLFKQLNSRIMVEIFKHIAVDMGLKTVAEFVETQDILHTLRDLNIDYGQGYHLGHPQKFTQSI